MTHTHSKFTRRALWIGLGSAVLVLTAVVTAWAAPNFRLNADPGADWEKMLQDNSQAWFGFGKPVEAAANTKSSTDAGDKAVTLAGGLTATLVSDKVGEDADMMDFWPNDEKPTHVIICNEIDGTVKDSPATIQAVNLSDGSVMDMAFGLKSCDPVHRTAWGTILVGEENGPAGRVWEIIDPLAVKGVKLDGAKGTSSDDKHIVARPALGFVSYEGIVILPDGTTYYGDELRPDKGRPGGGIYKFVPSKPFAKGGAAITSLDQSPFAEGSVYVMRLGLRSGGTDFGQGTNTGSGKWIGPISGGVDLTAAGYAYTGYYRPEDMDLDPIAFAKGQVRMCFPATGNDAQSTWGEVMCLTDDATTDKGYNTGTKPTVEPFVIGNAQLRMPDNVDFQPGTGILYVLMDATTSAENEKNTNDDVWACLPDGTDAGVLSDGCVRVMTLKDGAAEFTGILWYPAGDSFLIHLQHRTQEGRTTEGTTDMIKVTGFQAPGK